MTLVWAESLNMTPKDRQQKKKKDKWNCIQIKSFFTTKGTSKDWKTAYGVGDIWSHTADRGFISKIDKEFNLLNSKNTTQLISEQIIWIIIDFMCFQCLAFTNNLWCRNRATPSNLRFYELPEGSFGQLSTQGSDYDYRLLSILPAFHLPPPQFPLNTMHTHVSSQNCGFCLASPTEVFHWLCVVFVRHKPSQWVWVWHSRTDFLCIRPDLAWCSAVSCLHSPSSKEAQASWEACPKYRFPFSGTLALLSLSPSVPTEKDSAISTVLSRGWVWAPWLDCELVGVRGHTSFFSVTFLPVGFCNQHTWFIAASQPVDWEGGTWHTGTALHFPNHRRKSAFWKNKWVDEWMRLKWLRRQSHGREDKFFWLWGRWFGIRKTSWKNWHLFWDEILMFGDIAEHFMNKE